MNKLTKQEIRTLDNENLKKEIINIKRILFDFRMKQATRQNIKPNAIKAYKKQLAQIMTIQHEKSKN